MKNETEIARLAVEWARKVSNRPMNIDDDPETAKRILALAAPPVEPMPWPGMEGKPGVLKQVGVDKWYVTQGNHEWTIYGPSRNTPAEAVAEWNAVVRAVSGQADAEAVRLVGLARLKIASLTRHEAPLLDDIDRWLAARKGGGA